MAAYMFTVQQEADTMSFIFEIEDDIVFTFAIEEEENVENSSAT